jgi:hypothetical protein
MDTKVFGRGRRRVDIRATGPTHGDGHSDMAVVVPRADPMATSANPLKGSEPQGGSPRGRALWSPRGSGRDTRYPIPLGTREIREAVRRDPPREDDRVARSLRTAGARAEAEGGIPLW